MTFVEKFISTKECTGYDNVQKADYVREKILKIIDKTPNIDKIVEQLNCNYKVVECDEDLEWNRAIGKALNIVNVREERKESDQR